MKFPKFKPYLKYGLFLLFALSLVGTAYADANQLVYYNWDEDTGNTVVDSSGYENNGVNYGSTTFILPTGQTARHFDGQSRITIPANEQLTFTDPHITFGVFFSYNCSNPTNYTYLVSKGNDTCRIGIDHKNSTVVYEILTDENVISGYSECHIEPEEDYEAIVTYDGSHAQLYINGIAIGKGVNYTATALGSAYNTDNFWTIGASSDAEYGLNGTVYAFYVYDRTLNSSEVLDLYVNDLHSIMASNKPGGIALSWDDTAHIDTCYQYLSIFQKYNATCTMNVNKISNKEIPTETLVHELDALHSAGWEITVHGYNHTDSAIFLLNHTPAEWLDQEIFPNIVEITCYGYPVYSLAYPYSNRTLNSDKILAPYFRSLRTGVPDVINDNVTQTPLAYYDWDDASLLYGVEIDEHTDTSLQSIEAGIDYAIATDKVLVLYGHTITPNVTGKYQVSTSRLDEILNYTVQKGGVFYRLGDLGNSSWVRPARFSNVTADFTVSANTLLAGENVTFTDYSVNQTEEVLDFGDDSSVSSTANVNHTYTVPGTYTANLTVANDVSSHSKLQTITVVLPAAPDANFTSNVTTGYLPLSVAFTDTSTGLLTSWSWDFGDGSTSAIKNPTHTYSTAGNYTVTLLVSNLNGTDSKSAVITVLQNDAGRPVADFSTNVTGGYAPLSVTFIDLSQNATSISWDVNNDGVEDSTESSFVYEYSSAGTYTARLTAINANGTNSKTTTITVDRKSSGGSGGGGSAGGSPEPAKNVEVKELSQVFITNGNNAKFDFKNNVTPIAYLSFDAKKTVGKTTTIVEMLKNKSTLTSDAPAGEVYSYLNIWVGNSGFASETNIENAVVCFKVKKSWTQDEGINRSSIKLNRYSDEKWNELSTTLLREDNSYLYFTSETPGFSPFAITAEKTVVEVLPETPGDENNGNIESGVENVENTEASQKEELSTPGFEIIYCIIGLVGGFLHKKDKA